VAIVNARTLAAGMAGRAALAAVMVATGGR